MNPRISSPGLPFFEEGLKHEAIRVLWSGKPPEILRKFTRAKSDKPLFLHPSQGFSETLGSRNGNQARHRFSTISDQNLRPCFHLIQIFAKTGLELGHSGRLQNILPSQLIPSSYFTIPLSPHLHFKKYRITEARTLGNCL